MAANPGTILLIGGGALIAFLSARRRRPVEAERPGALCDPGPYLFNLEQVNQRIGTLLDAGRRDPATIAVDVATDLFDPHPSGASVVFPPAVVPASGLPLTGVACVFELTSKAAVDLMNARGLTQGPDNDASPVIFGIGQAGAPGYPWEEPLIQESNYPTPGMFFIQGQPTTSGSDTWTISTGSALVRAALGSAMAMAGNYKGDWVKSPPAGADSSGPNKHPYYNNDAKRLRKQMARLIRYSPFNDELYGQTNANYAGGNDSSKPGGKPNTALVDYMMDPCNRGLNWMPRHADNVGRLAQGLGPARTTSLTGEKLTTSPGPGSSGMQLWIPAVNMAMLGPNVPDASLSATTQGLQWSSGDATLIPPPQVWRKGIVNPQGGVAQWGCPGVQ